MRLFQVVGLRKDFQKSVFPSAHAPNNWKNSTKNEYERSASLISTDNSVPAATVGLRYF